MWRSIAKHIFVSNAYKDKLPDASGTQTVWHTCVFLSCVERHERWTRSIEGEVKTLNESMSELIDSR